MKKVTLIAGVLLWISVQAKAQVTSPNSNAPEISSQTFPGGEPSAKTDSMKSKLVKGTQSSRNARRTQEATVNKKMRTKKTVKTKKIDE